MTDHPTLRRLIQSELDAQGITARQAARRSDRVAYETLSAILRGQGAQRPRAHVLEGIAEALRVPASRVWEAAGWSRPEPWKWPERYDVLTARQRQIVESVAAGFAEANEAARRGG